MRAARLLTAAAALAAAAGAAFAADPGPPPVPSALPAPPDPVPDRLAALTACNPGPPEGGTFSAGGGVSFIRARFDNNMAFGVQTTTGRTQTNPGTRVTRRVEVDHGTVAAPEVWVAYVADGGSGGRVRYWQFWEGTGQTVGGSGQGANVSSLVSAAPLGLSLINVPSAMAVTTRLHLQTLDAEGLYAARAAGWEVLLAGGVRLARIDQAYNAFVPQAGNRALLSTNTFGGVGPTLAANARHALGHTPLSLYGSGRYSMVFGEAHQDAAIPDQNLFAQEKRNIGVGIAELELGLQYELALGRPLLTGQVGVVGQNWNGAGSASRSSVNVVPGGSFVGASYTGDSDINFVGLVLRVGVAY